MTALQLQLTFEVLQVFAGSQAYINIVRLVMGGSTVLHSCEGEAQTISIEQNRRAQGPFQH